VCKLKDPHYVSCIGSSQIVAHWKGDYPLVLRGPSGRTHVKLIRDILISQHTGANLLGTNCLNAADVGFDAPPAWMCAQAKLYIHFTDCTLDEFKLPKINGLWSVPDFRDIEFVEIPRSAYSAFNARHHAQDQPWSHQLRPLTNLELWHHGMCHAHPTKLAKLSQSCMGIKHPLPDVCDQPDRW
jgi:hypothetical protein